jgi:hypothetical protein
MGQTIGGLTASLRYERISVKERALRELALRLTREDWTFKTVQWTLVTRTPIPRDFKGTHGAAIAVVDGDETYGGNVQSAENSVEVMIEFFVSPASDEEPSTVLNLISAEIIDVLSGEHTLTEDGTGDTLALSLYARRYSPDMEGYQSGGTVNAVIVFEMRYRHRKNHPFELHR